jgi:hypothetical protein
MSHQPFYPPAGTSYLKSISSQTTKNTREESGKMGDQYLESGESIIMTTHHVSVDYVEFDLMLTTRRLILIDSQYARFEPRNIPFADIATVNSGRIPTGEPVLTITMNARDDAGAVVTINLIFIQQPDEKRKQERDEWLKKIMEYIVTARQNTTYTEVPAADQNQGIQPSMRRWLAPEVFGPKKDVAPVLPATLTVIPEPLPVVEPAQFSHEEPEYSSPETVPSKEISPATLVVPHKQSEIPEIIVPVVAEPGHYGVDVGSGTTGNEERLSPPEEVPATGNAPDGEHLPPDIATPLPQVPFINRWHWGIVIAAIIIVVIAIAGSGTFQSPAQVPPVAPTETLPVTTIPAITTTIVSPPTVPQTGVWVQVSYPGKFGGWIGNAGDLLPVSGTGTRFYKVPVSGELVQASIQKQDNTGDTLILTIYRNGTVITNRSTRKPLGTIDVLIDPMTGNPPGIPQVPTTAPGSGQNIQYF